jgi:hypothetical protein
MTNCGGIASAVSEILVLSGSRRCRLTLTHDEPVRRSAGIGCAPFPTKNAPRWPGSTNSRALPPLPNCSFFLESVVEQFLCAPVRRIERIRRRRRDGHVPSIISSPRAVNCPKLRARLPGKAFAAYISQSFRPLAGPKTPWRFSANCGHVKQPLKRL